MINANLTASQTAENLVKDLFFEHKKTRMSGNPRDFVDCYFDELDKVCMCVRAFVCVCVGGGAIFQIKTLPVYLVKMCFKLNLLKYVFKYCYLYREARIGLHSQKIC